MSIEAVACNSKRWNEEEPLGESPCLWALSRWMGGYNILIYTAPVGRRSGRLAEATNIHLEVHKANTEFFDQSFFNRTLRDIQGMSAAVYSNYAKGGKH